MSNWSDVLAIAIPVFLVCALFGLMFGNIYESERANDRADFICTQNNITFNYATAGSSLWPIHTPEHYCCMTRQYDGPSWRDSTVVCYGAQ